MTKPPLGRLQRVDLREYWEREDTDFTPWLAQNENISLLGETIGVDLEVLEQEANVGPFRADVLCRDVNGDAQVLIENQLEATDHGHLGQLITYAAGLETVYIIWIAQRFTEEHRAALDWLNGISDETAHFFGLEVELWRIEDSPPAPKFNLVSKPNEWTKSVKQAHQGGGGPGAPLKALWQAYWDDLKCWATENEPGFSVVGGGRSAFVRFRLAPPDCHVFAGLVVREKLITAAVTIWGDSREERLRHLEDRQSELEKQLGFGLEFSTSADGTKSYGSVSVGAELENRDKWHEYHRWCVDKVQALTRVFDSVIAEIDDVLAERGAG